MKITAPVSEDDLVQLVSVRQLQAPPVTPSVELDALTRSIRSHGVLHPLFIREKDGGFEIIAGKRRYAAAIAAGLSEVPCILKHVDDAEADALAAADNVRASATPSPLRALVASRLSAAVGDVAGGVSAMVRSLGLLPTMRPGYERDVVEDLVRAQAWRTLWLANAASFLSSGQLPDGRRRPLSGVVDTVVEAFEPERRLADIRFEVIHAPTRVVVDDSLVGLAVAGAIIVTLSIVRSVKQPVIGLRTQPLEDHRVALEVTQHHVPITREMSDRFSNREPTAHAVDIALAGMALAHATAAYGGASDLSRLGENGSAVRLTFRSLEVA
ncbi:MAG TPA: ParB N-terminal domain-containing protein [Vicinamibacterales bacterium]|nr:ParB N-terminal domain-containing protein [Vicinamibacterales bacterium]